MCTPQVPFSKGKIEKHTESVVQNNDRIFGTGILKTLLFQ